MFNRFCRSLVGGVIVCATLYPATIFAQSSDEETPTRLKAHTLNGPRLGISYVPSGLLQRNSELAQKLEKAQIGTTISQFGWHFEWLVTPQGGGPSFVTQLVPFLGGVEYGTVIPSASLVLGIRMPMGFEFGMGPNALFTFNKAAPVTTSLIVAIGQSFDFGGVSIPLNLALSTSREGNRFSFVFGYALRS
jgi:hypothetical protein